MASYPTSAKSFTTKTTAQTIDASHVNDLQGEVTAIEDDLIAGLPVARGGTGVRGFSAGSPGVQVQNTTAYYSEAFQSSDEDAGAVLITSAVTFRKLYVRTAAVVGGAAQTVTCTLRKNGADTALTASIASGAQTANDTANSVAFAAGDRIALKVVTSATTGNVQLQGGVSS